MIATHYNIKFFKFQHFDINYFNYFDTKSALISFKKFKALLHYLVYSIELLMFKKSSSLISLITSIKRITLLSRVPIPVINVLL